LKIGKEKEKDMERLANKFRISISALAVGITAIVASGQQSLPVKEAVATPNQVTYQEVKSHRIGDRPEIRIDLVAVGQPAAIMLQMGGLSVKVAVSPDGLVTSATCEGGVDLEIRKKAEAAVRATKYKPFERGGRPTEAQFVQGVAVLPPELQPFRHVLFRVVSDWNSVRITLRRIGCYGTCADYQLEIHGDGNVIYDGNAFVAAKGPQHGSILRESVEKLVDAFRDAAYCSLNDAYAWSATDLPTYETSIEIDGQLKRVRDYAGQEVGMLPTFPSWRT
jgi:hypothetical protein